MSFLGLVWRNLKGNAVRSGLTVMSAAVLLLLFSAWLTILKTMEANLEATRQHARISVHHRTSFLIPLPESYEARIRAIPGVRAVTCHALYGGQGPDERLFFPSIATDPDVWPLVFDDFVKDRAMFAAWAKERTGAIIGDDLARRFGWRPGQTVTLRGVMHPVDLKFKISGILEGFLNPQIFLMHKKYLDEAVGAKGVNMYWARVDKVEDIPRVAQAIDALFANSPAETMSESERDMYMGFVGMQSQVIGMIKGVGPLVLLIMVIVCANTMGMAVRDRSGQLAVMKCLGFPSRYLLGLILVEGGLLTLVGGAMGSGATYVLFSRGFGLGFGPLARFTVSPLDVLIGIALSVAIGLAAAALPAIAASRVAPVLTLRQVK